MNNASSSYSPAQASTPISVTDSTSSSSMSSKATTPDSQEEPSKSAVDRKNKRKISKSVDLDNSQVAKYVNLTTSTTTTTTSANSSTPDLSTKPQPNRVPQENGLTNGIKWLTTRSKVFVSIDLEYWEVNNKYLTEIGIAIYDPTQIGLGSHPILPKVKACHYVVAENKNKTNGKFVPNNMFKYSYGETLIMPMKDCKRAVEEILTAQAKNNNLVIVGHGVSGDIRVLQKNGFKLPQHEVLDTLKIWRLTRKEGFGSLDKLLTYLEIPHGIMHNAGNDAYLNIQLFLALCDPEVRLQKNLDQDPGETMPVPASSTSSKKKSKRRDSTTHRSSNADDAIKLMI